MFDGQLVRLEAVIIQTNIIRHKRTQHNKQEEDFTIVCSFFSPTFFRVNWRLAFVKRQQKYNLMKAQGARMKFGKYINKKRRTFWILKLKKWYISDWDIRKRQVVLNPHWETWCLVWAAARAHLMSWLPSYTALLVEMEMERNWRENSRRVSFSNTMAPPLMLSK